MNPIRPPRRAALCLAALGSALLAGPLSANDAPAPPPPPAGPSHAASHALFKKIQLSDKFYSEGAAFGDFNKDGVQDIVAGPYWYEGPDFSKKHQIYPAKPIDPHGYSKNFLEYVYDFNGDGYPDVLVVGFPGEPAVWYENPGAKAGAADEPWKAHSVFPTVDNESPIFVDVDGDGRPDLLCMSGKTVGYATFDPADATKPWVWHAVSDKNEGYQRFTHGIGYGDILGNGKTDILVAGGWYEQPAQRDEKGGTWKFHKFPFADEGAQMYVYDVDGDGKNDVITSQHAHGYGLRWWQNTGPDDKGEVQFKLHQIIGPTFKDNPYGVKFSQLHGVDLVDIDGDGLKDIVTGKRYWAHGPGGDAEPSAPAVLYWFRLVRGPGGAEFIPYEIDDNSGVGTQVMAGGVDKEHKLPNIVVGNKKGTFIFINQIDQMGKDAVEKLKPAKVNAEAGMGGQ